MVAVTGFRPTCATFKQLAAGAFQPCNTVLISIRVMGYSDRLKLTCPLWKASLPDAPIDAS
jgi:hypothetical protein